MRAPTRARRTICVSAALAALSGPTGAAAQSDRVFVDPESPAGKEYALPLESARRDASPTAGDGGSGGAPLFGAGISSARDEQGQAASRDQDGGGANGSSGGQSVASDPDGAGVKSSGATAAVVGGGTGPSAGLLTALIAGAVLLTGAIIGLGLRALRRANPAD